MPPSESPPLFNVHFVFKITTGNEAMQTGGDLAYVLRKLAKKFEDAGNLYDSTGQSGKLMDLNGNCVGKWEIIEEDPGD